jgi:hypothetical protein
VVRASLYFRSKLGLFLESSNILILDTTVIVTFRFLSVYVVNRFPSMRIFIYRLLLLSLLSVGATAQLCAVLPPVLELLASIATCANINYNEPIDAYLSIIDDLPLDQCIEEATQPDCLTIIQNYETSATSTYLSSLVHGVINDPIDTCPCLAAYVSELAGCLKVVEDLYTYCLTFYPESTGNNDEDDAVTDKDDGSSEIDDSPDDETDWSTTDDEADEEDDETGEAEEDDDARSDDIYNVDDDEFEGDDYYEGSNESPQTCSDLLIESCSYGLGLTFEEAIGCAMSAASSVGSFCQPLLNAVLSSIATACQEDISRGCRSSLDSAEHSLTCLQSLDGLSMSCKKRMMDISVQKDVPCSSEALYYCKDFHDIDDILSCLSVTDPVKVSYLCQPFIRGYATCSGSSSGSFDDDTPGGGGKLKPKPGPQDDDNGGNDQATGRKRKRKPKPRPDDDGSSRSLRREVQSTAAERKYSIYQQQFDLSSRHLQGKGDLSSPCWMLASQASSGSYPGSPFDQPPPQQPSLMLIAIVCMVSVFIASIAVTMVKRFCKSKVPADGKGRYAPAATNDELDSDGAPAKSAIALSTFASSTREVVTAGDYIPPNAISTSSSYDTLPCGAAEDEQSPDA